MIEQLTKEQIDNYNLFFNTIKSLRASQGFYYRLFEHIVNLSENDLYEFTVNLPKFNDALDVMLYLE